MIANKHTELRIYDNLNSLLRASLDEKEYKERINRHIAQYIRNYVDEQSWDKNVYDVFEELGDSYQKHCWNIAKRIEDEILEEKKETNWLDPNVYTDDFKETLIEELTNKILPHYFKELNNQINVYEYKNKINGLRKKNNKATLKEKYDDIVKIIRDTIEDDYNICLKEHNNNHKLILDNFESIRDVRDTLLQDSIDNIFYGLEEKFDKADIENVFKKELALFIKEQKQLLGLNKKQSKDTLGQIIQHPKLARAVMISKMWKDITK